MSLPCPQRDALEALVKSKTKALQPGVLSKRASFKLTDGTQLFLLGVSPGASMRKDPNLHIAVFSIHPPRGRTPKHKELLPLCRFATLLTGPEDGNLFTVEGLDVVSTGKKVMVFSKNGHRRTYRSIV